MSENEHDDRLGTQNGARSQIDRRRFLTRLALGAGIAPVLSLADRFGLTLGARAPQPPRNVRLQSSPVLAPGDFVYLGAMRVPTQLTQFSFGTMAARSVNGRLQFLMTGNNSQDAAPDVLDAVWEFADTQSYDRDPTRAPRATVLTKWGDIYQGKRVRYDPQGRPVPLEYLATGGMYWKNNRLYWTFFDYYNVDQRPDPSIGMTDLKDSPAHMVAYGPWNADISSHHASGWLVDLPDGTLGVGAPSQGGNAGSSWGPELNGGSPWPTETTPAGFRSPALRFPKVYLRFAMDPGLDQLNADGSVTSGTRIKRARRPANFMWHVAPDINPARAGGQGYWTQADGTQACVYIDLPDKAGILFHNTLGIGNVWYGDPTALGGNPCGGGQGENANNFEPRWHIYDPADCQKVIAGTLPPYAITPKSDFNPLAAIDGFRIGCDAHSGGMYFDANNRRLYVSTSRADVDALPLIHVFRIR
jgi:hypothetical protein